MELLNQKEISYLKHLFSLKNILQVTQISGFYRNTLSESGFKGATNNNQEINF